MQLGGVKGFKNVKVGGAITWRVPDGNDTSFYDQWASSKRFHVGDSLYFQYKNDSVLVVDKYGYYHCDPSKATGYFTDGNTTIKLEHSGLTYFISGNAEHCKSGQRLMVDVMSQHSPSVAAPPASHDHHAQSPTPAQAHNSGSQIGPMAQVSATLVGLVATSLVLV
ncbi:hypothetical protein BVRB_9g221860 [Beta vulgaris subsp. vulgaris]|nr:hypothetical protein BVRB_9g221860 [Beta vulgaris subsp. vulgaris]